MQRQSYIVCIFKMLCWDCSKLRVCFLGADVAVILYCVYYQDVVLGCSKLCVCFLGADVEAVLNCLGSIAHVSSSYQRVMHDLLCAISGLLPERK